MLRLKAGALGALPADIERPALRPGRHSAARSCTSASAPSRAPIWLPSTKRLCTRPAICAGASSGFDAGLHEWIESHCTFPNSMVDRIMPRTTEDDRARIARRLGCADAWPVVAEPFLDWVIEDRFAAGRPGWEHGGARFSPMPRRSSA
jgi:fructuronate reductase